MAPNKNGTSQKWHPTTYIVVKNPGLSLNKPRGHCNIEFGVKGYFLKKFNTFCPSLCTEMETIETALSIRICPLEAVFEFKFGLEKYLEIFT